MAYSCLLNLLDYNAAIFAASLLISSCIFSSMTLSAVFTISLYILSERFFLKSEELSHTRVVSITKNEYGFAAHFL